MIEELTNNKIVLDLIKNKENSKYWNLYLFECDLFLHNKFPNLATDSMSTEQIGAFFNIFLKQEYAQSQGNCDKLYTNNEIKNVIKLFSIYWGVYFYNNTGNKIYKFIKTQELSKLNLMNAFLSDMISKKDGELRSDFAENVLNILDMAKHTNNKDLSKLEFKLRFEQFIQQQIEVHIENYCKSNWIAIILLTSNKYKLDKLITMGVGQLYDIVSKNYGSDCFKEIINKNYVIMRNAVSHKSSKESIEFDWENNIIKFKDKSGSCKYPLNDFYISKLNIITKYRLYITYTVLYISFYKSINEFEKFDLE